MAITNLQQARQMFRHGGDTMGGPNDRSVNTGGYSGGGSDAGFANTSPSRVGGTGGFQLFDCMQHHTSFPQSSSLLPAVPSANNSSHSAASIDIPSFSMK